MENTIFNFHDIILLTTTYQSILFAVLIFAIKHDRKSDFFLIGFLLTQAAIPLHILINYGEEFRFIALEISPNLYNFFDIAYWLEGPLLLFYTRSLVYKDYSLKKTDLLYALPVALYLIYTSITFYTVDSATKISLLHDYQTINASLLNHSIGFLREGLRVMFSVLCIIEIHRCRQQIRNRYSSLEKVDLGWLNFLVIGFLFVRIWACLVSVAIILSSHTGININFNAMGLLGNYCTLGLVSALIYFGIRHSSIFEGIENSLLSKKVEHTHEIDTEKVSAIEDHMRTHKPYLANILTLEQLANQLGMQPRSLSTIINRHFKRNFFEFINEYRIKEAKLQLADPKHKSTTIIEIMTNSGFNSKATFNTFFKKNVGSTPSQYRASQHNNNANTKK